MKTAPEYIKTLFETHADKEGNVKLGKQSLINLLANFHSQFSIGGEEAFKEWCVFRKNLCEEHEPENDYLGAP